MSVPLTLMRLAAEPSSLAATVKRYWPAVLHALQAWQSQDHPRGTFHRETLLLAAVGAGGTLPSVYGWHTTPDLQVEWRGRPTEERREYRDPPLPAPRAGHPVVAVRRVGGVSPVLRGVRASYGV
jgi:hypothetical protein